MPTATHTTLDGGRASITSTDLDLSRDATSSAVFVLNSARNQRSEVTVGTIDFGRQYVLRPGVPLTDAYALQGGTLRVGVGDGVVNGVCAVLWEGQKWSATTHLYGGATARDAIDLFSRFSLSETSDSLIVSPIDQRAAVAEAPARLLKEVPGLGLVEVNKLTPAQMRLLPSWKGAAVRGGELFVEDEGLPSFSFVLAGQNAVTVIMPRHDDYNRDQDAFIASLSDLTVMWAA